MSEQTHENLEVTCDDFSHAIKHIGTAIKAYKTHYDFILGISRGGLVPAVALSHYLQIPMYPVHWSQRDSGIHYIDDFVQEQILRAKNVLIVEDIVDSGVTFAGLFEALDKISTGCKFDTAALVTNISQKYTPTFSWILIDRDIDKRWVNFFWELKDEGIQIDDEV